MDSDVKGWQPASVVPPDGEYVCFTNYGDVFFLRCVGGVWVPPARFNKGEKVSYWIRSPETRRGDA